MYTKQGKDLLVMNYYEKVLETKMNIPSITYSALPKIQFKLRNYYFALKYLQKCLKKAPETAH
jgi:hypothetical protein